MVSMNKKEMNYCAFSVVHSYIYFPSINVPYSILFFYDSFNLIPSIFRNHHLNSKFTR